LRLASLIHFHRPLTTRPFNVSPAVGSTSYQDSTGGLPLVPEAHGGTLAAQVPYTFPQVRAKSPLPLRPWPILLSYRLPLLLQEIPGDVVPGSRNTSIEVKYERLDVEINRPFAH